jgi:hypothetical protein
LTNEIVGSIASTSLLDDSPGTMLCQQGGLHALVASASGTPLGVQAVMNSQSRAMVTMSRFFSRFLRQAKSQSS